MSLDDLLPFANHLWQSTLFVVAVWLVILTLRKNRAAVRHRLWLAASVKFLVPFSLLTSIGSHLQWETSVGPPPAVFLIVERISQPFSASRAVVSLNTTSASRADLLAAVLIGVWICGIAVSSVWWFSRWWQVRRTVRMAAPSNLDGPLRVRYGPAHFEPGVFGIFSPVLLLPETIRRHLSAAQLQAVLAHELCHVRRRDNLAMSTHMIVETLFWFHPFVWFIKVRLIEEQERACDEEVLRLGGDSQIYAESILKICEFYLASPLITVSGISGSNLKERIEHIMRNQVALKLSLIRALLIAVAAIASLAGPIIVGVTCVKAGEARSEHVLQALARPLGTGGELPLAPQTTKVQAPQTAPTRIATVAQTGGERGSPWLSRVMSEYRVGQVRVAGAKILDNDAIRSSIGLVSGEVYDESRIHEGFQALTEFYGSLGYVNFLPEPVLDFDDQKKVVNLTINIDEGPQYTVNRISFTGNMTTPDQVIRWEILLKEGQIFNASLLDSSLLRLNQLDLFDEIKFADFWIKPLPNEPKLDIDLRVHEKGR
jgi:beta-lactamase regulating signal transducer with metallopeptidase domain